MANQVNTCSGSEDVSVVSIENVINLNCCMQPALLVPTKPETGGIETDFNW